MTTLLRVKQGSVEHALTVPEDTLFFGVCELMNAWEHKECFTFGSEAAWMLDLDGTEVEWSSIPKDTPVAAVIGDYSVPTVCLQAVATPVLKLPVVTADGNACAALELSVGTAEEVMWRVSELYDGGLDAAAVQIPGRSAGSFLH